jgi:hypothetical protein
MLFQSQFYVLIFLPPVAAVYYLCAESAVKRRWVLIAASLVFYAWWDLRFVVLPVGQIVLTWLLALARECSKSRALLIAGIALNLLSLDTFKYLDFILGSIESAPNRRPAPAARRLQCAKNIGTRESSPNPLPPPLSADERRRMSFPALVWLDARLAHCQPTAARFWP